MGSFLRVLAVVSLVPLFTACDSGGPPDATGAGTAVSAASEPCRDRDAPAVVMSRNLYLGGDLGGVVAAQSQAAFLAATTEVWSTVVGNDFHQRARLLADEIARARPSVVGLQEAYLWRSQHPYDPTSAATKVEYDYVAELLQALEARGERYEVAESLELFDFEAPTLPAFDEVRMTDRQVILVRAGVEHRNARGALYSVLLPVQVLTTTVPVKRGWTAVEVKLDGRWVTFFDTHTESFYAPVRVAQGMELAAILAATPGDVILVGDLNSLPGTEAAASVAGAGFTDAWAALHPRKAGFTCCWPEALAETTPGLDQRIDYVFSRGLRPQTIQIVGDEPRDHRTGLWPTDHAGLVARLKFAKAPHGDDDGRDD